MATPPIVATEYDIGNNVRTTAVFKIAGVPTDADVLRFKYKTPAGVVTTVTYPDQIAKSATGTYYFVLNLNAIGSWWYRWEATGNLIAAKERRIQVRPTEF